MKVYLAISIKNNKWTLFDPAVPLVEIYPIDMSPGLHGYSLEHNL